MSKPKPKTIAKQLGELLRGALVILDDGRTVLLETYEIGGCIVRERVSGGDFGDPDVWGAPFVLPNRTPVAETISGTLASGAVIGDGAAPGLGGGDDNRGDTDPLRSGAALKDRGTTGGLW